MGEFSQLRSFGVYLADSVDSLDSSDHVTGSELFLADGTYTVSRQHQLAFLAGAALGIAALPVRMSRTRRGTVGLRSMSGSGKSER